VEGRQDEMSPLIAAQLENFPRSSIIGVNSNDQSYICGEKLDYSQACTSASFSSFFPNPCFASSASTSAGLYIFALGFWVCGSSVRVANSTIGLKIRVSIHIIICFAQIPKTYVFRCQVWYYPWFCSLLS
jgi:hypothetical protein